MTYVNPTEAHLKSAGFLPLTEGEKVEQAEETVIQFRYLVLDEKIIKDDYLTVTQEE